jgi:hypothetical protein
MEELSRVEDGDAGVGLESLPVLLLLPAEVPDVPVGKAEAVPASLRRPQTDCQAHVWHQTYALKA